MSYEDDDDFLEPLIVTDSADLTVYSGVAVVPVVGVLTYADSVQIAQQVAHVRRHSKARGLLLVVDSPGGDVRGVSTIVDEIHRTRRLLGDSFVAAHGLEIVASGGYWIASAAGRLTVGRSAEVGSIGVVAVLIDASERYAQSGLSVRVVRSGADKALAQDGEAVDARALDAVQQRVDAVHQLFVDDVARGRGVDRATADAWATGALWSAAEAVDRGLVDGVGDLDAALRPLMCRIASKAYDARHDHILQRICS
ncbi:MAG: S49 family peptidase [Acidobacteriota bacterium]